MSFEQLRSVVATLESDIEQGPIVPTVTPEEIRNHLARYDFANPVPFEELTADVEQMMRRWHVQVTHPRYFGLFNPSVTFSSIVADTLVAMYNPQLATWRTSPAANEMERHTLAWLAAKFGFPSNAAANFTSGGAESNLSAAIVALTRAFPDFCDHGMRKLSAQPTIYLTAEAHHSFSKIAHMTGLGRDAVRIVATDCHQKIDLQDLATRVAVDRENGFAPFMGVGTAGTTGTGAIDPLPDLGRFCRSENLWFHVDAAWGGAAILSPRLKHHLAGINGADSITCDAHKWFSVPMGAGMFFCRHPDAVRETFRADSYFMPAKTDGAVDDPYTTSIQWSRRFIGLKLFLAMAELGEAGYAAMIEHQAHIGELLRELLRRSGWNIVNTTPLPLVCFTRPGLDVTRFLAALHERQIAWMSEVRMAGGAPVLRACITSFRATETHLQWVVREMDGLI
jgi:glutamate/tyrosine decarboxylase-like PLP-dependent enzyme